ncbi:MAG: chaperonin GroEL [Gammaproteobacteria bacterium]|nr:chaperonin GroEL [Gammaproteobacteria bacterium]|tara:strand:- start:29 stop:1678 length:1650 start_codon:yes stop_codon:yes gene_type:complete
MTAKLLSFSDQARARMLEGVDTLSDAVRVTLGPKGRNVLFETDMGQLRVTKDGVTVAKEIELKDRTANMGAQIVKEAANRTAEIAGDGTSTSTILARAIIHEGLKAVTAGMNPMDLKRGIDLAVSKALKHISSQSKPVANHDQITRVGTVASNNNLEVGKMISNAMQEVGEDGVITVEEGTGRENELEIVEGMRLDKGFASPYFVTEDNGLVSNLTDPYILIVDHKISDARALISVMEKVTGEGKNRSLFVIADDVEGDSLAAMVVNHMRGTLKCAAIKAPSFGDRRKAILEDIAILTGGKVLTEELGNKLEDLELKDFGSAKRVEIDKDETMIVGARGTSKSVKDRCDQIRRSMASEESEYEKERYQERLARLVGGVAILRIGGSSEAEVKEKKDLVDDALHATRCAVEEGIVPGGGVALLYASKSLKRLKGENQDQDRGIAILKESLSSAVIAIADNAGEKGDLISSKLLEKNDTEYGFDAAKGKYCNLIKAGIIDPAKVVRTALIDAASVANSIITAEAALVEDDNAHEILEDEEDKYIGTAYDNY